MKTIWVDKLEYIGFIETQLNYRVYVNKVYSGPIIEINEPVQFDNIFNDPYTIKYILFVTEDCIRVLVINKNCNSQYCAIDLYKDISEESFNEFMRLYNNAASSQNKEENK